MALHCIGNYEQNLYHDSYFHSLFWDDEARTITTREVGATAYGGGVTRTTLTSDPAVWAAVEAYKAAEEAKRKAKVRKAKADRIKAARAILKANGVHTAFCAEVLRTNGLEILEDIAALFNSRVRNSFKLAMRDHAKAWKPGTYATPFSKKMVGYIRRPMVDQYGRPTSLARTRAALNPVHPYEGLLWRGYRAA